MAKVDVYCRDCHKSEHVKGHGKVMADIPVIASMPAVRSFSWNTPIKLTIIDKV